MDPEKDNGNIEYKFQLINLTPKRVDGLMTQLKYRINEGDGEAIYEIGVSDDGRLLGLHNDIMKDSLNNLKNIVSRINASIVYTTIKDLDNKLQVAEVLIRESPDTISFIDIFVATIGNVDSGKSSLIGVLTRGVLDNGRGKARSMIMQFKHELDSGRTSTCTHHIMGFNNDGSVISDEHLTWKDVVLDSKKIITFADLCGHEKYLRTTIYGMSSIIPDYAMILVGANMGITNMTKEHLSICLSLKIPIIIVVTKIDIAPSNILEQTMTTLTRLLKLPGVRKVPYVVKKEDEISLVAKNVVHNNIVPIFMVSNVSGQGISYLKTFYNLLPKRRRRNIHEPVEFCIDGMYMVTGIGTVVSGILNSGTIKVSDYVLLGPNGNGEFIKTQIRSIHSKRLGVSKAQSGDYICIALKKISKNQIRKGMVLISHDNKYRSCNEFECSISIIHSHHTTIRKYYQPYLHIGNVRQAAKILSIQDVKTRDVSEDSNNPILRAGDKALVRMRFIYRPEYIRPDTKLIFREGRIRGVGIITKVYPITKKMHNLN